MSGDDRVRHCSLCSLNVYNFAEMTRAEIQSLLVRSEGRVCARLYRRADGTVITRDCPRGLRAVGQRVSRVAAAAIAALFSLSAFASDGKTCEKARVKKGSKVKLAIEQAKTPQKAAFTGVVLLNGEPLPGVRVLVRNESTKSELRAVTDINGAFANTQLDDGLYRVEMTLESFKPAVIEHLELKSSEVTKAVVAMQFDQVMESITVGAVGPEPNQPLTTTFTQTLINKLPL